MNFVQIEFLGFFLTVYTLYWLVGDRRLQNVLLAVSSAVFYGWIHPWFLILLYSSAVLDFFMGLSMRKWAEHKKWFLYVSLAGNIGMLGTFKYLNWFIESWVSLFDALGLQTDAHTLGIFLPAGISFYTFQTMSYTIDIYKGKLEPRSNFLDYVVFISFFPQLVAGPIERAANLLPQMEKERTFSWERMASGFGLMMMGLFKKVAIADAVAPYVDKCFQLTEPSCGIVWAGGLGFCVQVLGDFSGYTDLARGSARMLGFDLIKNFNHPYLSHSPSNFWERWHMSFSNWIRDYVYIPLGGNRGSWLFKNRNMAIAMMFSGIWHGAAWNFVMWGAYYVVWIFIFNEFSRFVPQALKDWKWQRHVMIVVTLPITAMGMVVFRSGPLHRIWLHWQVAFSPFGDTPEQWAAAAALMGVFVGSAVPLILMMWAEWYVRPWIKDSPWRLPARTTMWTIYALAAASFVRVTAEDFVYFQF